MEFNFKLKETKNREYVCEGMSCDNQVLSLTLCLVLRQPPYKVVKWIKVLLLSDPAYTPLRMKLDFRWKYWLQATTLTLHLPLTYTDRYNSPPTYLQEKKSYARETLAREENITYNLSNHLSVNSKARPELCGIASGFCEWRRWTCHLFQFAVILRMKYEPRSCN